MATNKKHKIQLIRAADRRDFDCFGLLRRTFGVLFLSLLLLSLPSTAVMPPLPPITVVGPFTVPPLPVTPQVVKNPEPAPLPDPFPRVAGLYTQKAFWKEIFTKYTRRQFVVHDDWYVDVTFEVVEPEETGRAAWRTVREREKHYRELLKKAAENWDDPKKMSPEVRKVYKFFNQVPENEHFPRREAYKRIRAQRGQADSFRKGIAWAGRFMPDLQNILREHGLPEKLAYLPLIESAYNPRVRSHVGAAGMWQLMPFVGKHYGLRVDHLVDERHDPFAATHAAARHLTENYESLKSWPLAITAYNHGLGGMKNAVKQVGSKDMWEIAQRYRSRTFGFSSRNFYAEFLVAIDILDNPATYYPGIEIDPPQPTRRFRLPDHVSAHALERHCGLPLAVLQTLNPALQPASLEEEAFIPGGTTLNIPSASGPLFIAAYHSLPDDLKFHYVAGGTHRVQRGETLGQIAMRYGTSVNTLKQLNGIRKANRLRYGQNLKLPGRYTAMEKSAAPSPAKTEVKKMVAKKDSDGRAHTRIEKPNLMDWKSHRVRRGETLSQIARRYGISIKLIAQHNEIENLSKIKFGQVLKIPEG